MMYLELPVYIDVRTLNKLSITGRARRSFRGGGQDAYTGKIARCVSVSIFQHYLYLLGCSCCLGFIRSNLRQVRNSDLGVRMSDTYLRTLSTCPSSRGDGATVNSKIGGYMRERV